MTDLRFFEWERCDPESRAELQGLSIEEPYRQAAAQLTDSRLIELLELRNGLLVQTTSYVGRVKFGDLQITISPKIQDVPLMNLLRYAYDFRQLKLYSELTHETEDFAFQDLIIHQLGVEVEELLLRGLYVRYLLESGHLSRPKGRIDFVAYVRDGAKCGARLPCSYFPRLRDNVFNRTVLAGLNLAVRLTSSTELRAKLRRSAKFLEDSVSPVNLNPDVFKRVESLQSRLTRSYEPAVGITQMLYESTGLSLEGVPSETLIPGFLFDMNRFFQSLIGKFLRESLPGYTVKEEYRLREMMSYLPDHNPRKRKAPLPRPDFVVQEDNETIAVLDTKDRDLWEAALPRDMLYQLCIYALSREADRRSIILYPTTHAQAEDAVVGIRDPVSGKDRARVIIRPVNLKCLEQLISEPSSAAAERQRVGYAGSLIRTST